MLRFIVYLLYKVSEKDITIFFLFFNPVDLNLQTPSEVFNLGNEREIVYDLIQGLSYCILFGCAIYNFSFAFSLENALFPKF